MQTIHVKYIQNKKNNKKKHQWHKQGGMSSCVLFMALQKCHVK